MDGENPMQFARPDSRLTYDDFVQFPDDGLRHEIIDGEHYVSPCPNTRHQRLVGRLHAELAFYLREHPDAGEAFLAPFDVVFTRWDVVEPDLLFIASDQTAILTPANVQGAPAIVIEVLSPATRKVDEKIKYTLFKRGGVREYWLIDPELDVIKVFRRDERGELPRVAELTSQAADTLTTPLLPGFAVSLSSFLRD